MKKYKVAIDVGHARSTGARGNGYEEHEVCKVIAGHVKRYLEGFRVTEFEADVVDFEGLSNEGDLAATVKAVNAGGYDVCVSLHMDASDRADARGAHVCYVSEAGRKLAEEVAQRLCPQLPGRAERVVRRPGLYVLRKTRPVAVLVECGFITHGGDAKWVVENPDKVALSVALGVAAWCDGLGVK